MPREEIVIQNFDKGMISGADQNDISHGAAAWTQDINSNPVPGTISARKDDSIYVDTANNYAFEKSAWITRADGKRDLIIYDAKGNSIVGITDFNGTPTYGSSLGTPSGTSITMDTINRAVRVGQGDYAGKYVGYIDYGQFGAAASSSLQYTDAELSSPVSFPTPYKIISDISDSTYIYGIEWQGRKILKITSATGAYTESTVEFISLQGICNIDATYFYVYEAIGQFGDLHKIKKSDLSINATYHITGWGAANAYANQSGGTYMSDIELTTNKIWFGFWSEDSGGFPLKNAEAADSGKIIFNFALSSLVADSNHATTDVTFVSTAPSPIVAREDVGNITAYTTTTQIYADSFYADTVLCTYWVKPSRRCFVRTDVATEIGWLGNVGLLNRAVYLDDATSLVYMGVMEQARFGGRGIIFMNESSAKDDRLHSTNTHFRSLDTGTTTYTEDTDATYYTDGLRLAGSTYTDYIFTGKDLAAINMYRSNPTGDNEFILADAHWDTTTTAPATYTFETSAYTRTEEETWHDYTKLVSGTTAKSVIGIMSDITVSVKSIATDTVLVFCMSSKEGAGKFNILVYNTSSESMPTAPTYIKASPTWFHPAEATDDIGVFDTTKSYFYKLIFKYDNYQYSSVSQLSPARVSGLSSGTNTINIKIELYSTSTYISPRVTDIIILRAEAAGTNSWTPTSLYRIVGTISLVSVWASDSTESATWGTKKQISFTDTGLYSSSYENETGCPETLPNNTMDYTISCTGAGYLFVGQGFNDELNEISNFIFRSKKNAPDTFDWSNDFCILPTMPIALYFWKSYLYAFDSNRMYVIDPENLVLIGQYEGYGVQSALAICSNEEAMFFASVNNIYMHDGKQPVIISEAINQVGTAVSGATSHRTLASGRTIQLVISSHCNSLIVAYFKYTATLDTYTPMFVMNLNTRAWYFWQNTNVQGSNITYNTADKRSLIVDYLGRVYLSVYRGIYKLLGSSTEKTSYWWTPVINFGDDTTLKKIYKITYDATASTPCSLDYNNAQTFATSVTNGSYLTNLATKYKSIQLKFTLSSTYLILRGITIIFRKMIGLR